jgi:hypothetical protein
MDRAVDRIEQHIDRERAVLLSNLEELEDRVASVVDWRRHFRSNPATWVGAAFGCGLMMALAAARRPRAPRLDYPRAAASRAPYSGSPATYSEHRQRELSRVWLTIESALIGLAAAKLKQKLAELLPGFREQLAPGEGAGYARDSAARSRSRH